MHYPLHYVTPQIFFDILKLVQLCVSYSTTWSLSSAQPSSRIPMWEQVLNIFVLRNVVKLWSRHCNPTNENCFCVSSHVINCMIMHGVEAAVIRVKNTDHCLSAVGSFSTLPDWMIVWAPRCFTFVRLLVLSIRWPTNASQFRSFESTLNRISNCLPFVHF